MKNHAASVRARLLAKARSAGENFDLTLTRYGIERLLYRLVAAGHANQFILKGAQLLHAYTAERYRPTRDLDLLGFGSDDPDRLAGLFRELCTVQVEPDGLDFDASTVDARTIREDAEYGGVRIRLIAKLGSARIRLQVDIGFGDVITPGPQVITYPVILDAPAPVLRAYPMPTIVAEKFESLVSLGLTTSRMKDIYDLWRILTTFDIDTNDLQDAISRAFERRKTQLDREPAFITEAFWGDEAKQQVEGIPESLRSRSALATGDLPSGGPSPSAGAHSRDRVARRNDEARAIKCALGASVVPDFVSLGGRYWD